MSSPKPAAFIRLNYVVVVPSVPQSQVSWQLSLGFLGFFTSPTQNHRFFAAEFLGFNNKTCDSGVPPKSKYYGNTVGPLLRETDGESHLWKWWDVAVIPANNASSMVTVKNTFPSGKGKPRCFGYYITDYYHYKNKKACTELPWATRVHLHKESRPWQMLPVQAPTAITSLTTANPRIAYAI